MKKLNTVNWFACCIAASLVAFFGFEHLQRVLLSVFSIPAYYYWTSYILSIISPICIAVAWLRLTGTKWRQTLSLFLFVPLGVSVLWWLTHVLPYMIAN